MKHFKDLKPTDSWRWDKITPPDSKGVYYGIPSPCCGGSNYYIKIEPNKPRKIVATKINDKWIPYEYPVRDPLLKEKYIYFTNENKPLIYCGLILTSISLTYLLKTKFSYLKNIIN